MVCIVYDTSVRSTGCSFNECLYRGLKFEQEILDQFQTYCIALTADIKKAFLMICVHEEDRNVLQFLWVDDLSSDAPNIGTRVVFSVSSSPLLLNATLQHHLDRYSTSHPDTWSSSLPSLLMWMMLSVGEKARSKHTNFILIQSKSSKKGGFNLRKFVTNSDALKRKIDDEGFYKSQRVSPPVSQSEPP